MDIFELKEKYDAFMALNVTEQIEHEDAKLWTDDTVTKSWTNDTVTKASFNFEKYVKFEKYISVAVKEAGMNTYLDSVIHEEDGFLTYNGLEEEILRTITIVLAYTDLTFADDMGVNAYDAICAMRLYDKIVNTYDYEPYSYDDAYDYSILLREELKHIIEDYNSPGGAMYRLNEQIKDTLNGVIDRFESSLSVNPEEIQKVADTLKNINTTMDEVQKIGSVGGKNGTGEVLD